MISEQVAFDALPPAGFIRDYTLYAAKCTTAPLAYHIGVGLSMLASTVPVPYGTRFAINQRANIFVMLAGRSGDDQKSTAIEIGREILFEAAPNLIGDQPGSAEGMIESLSKQPTQLLVYKEMGKLLSAAQRGYLEPLKALLTDLSDCSSQQRVKAKKKGQDDIVWVSHPRLSIFGACSLPFLEKHTDAVDWTGGFLGRWALLFAFRERTNSWPEANTTGRPGLVTALQQRALTQKAGWCLGMHPKTRPLWDEWFFNVEQRKLPNLVHGARTRAPIVALKAALLYGWDFGPATAGDDWVITEQELLPAIKFAEMYLMSIVSLAGRLAEHPDARHRRHVLEAFTNGEILQLGEVLSRTKMAKRRCMEMLDGLSEEEVLERFNLPGGKSVWRRKH